MEKLKMHSPNITSENIEKIRQLFPNCVTEASDDLGNITLAVDFDLLRQELSDSITEGPQERYTLNWPGKREALLTANAPIAKTMRPCREESVDFDATKNLYIEGDNLEALKLLQETYLGKVKMIYIDPPYNTGNDFIYEDDFAENTGDYLIRSNQKDEHGNRLIANSESNGRFHSDWLSMMYSRLKLARNLLRDDGVIFISIDDNEVANLKRICDEVFGEDNFVAMFVWQRRVSSAMSNNNVSTDHEYVICVKKCNLPSFIGLEKDFKKYTNPDDDPRGPWIADNLTVGMSASMRPNQAYDIKDPATGKIYPFNPNRVWAFIPESMDKLIMDGRILFPNDTSKRPMQKRFMNELKSQYNPFSSLLTDLVGLNTEATRQIQDIMGSTMFNYSKPLSLLNVLIPQVSSSGDIILDFFSGSATTAHAVMQLNAEDGGNRQFIMVQLPEPCDEKSEAYKAGFKTIAEIGKERIRRAGRKIMEGETHKDWSRDIGFRVLKIDSSNMKDVFYNPDQIHQRDLNVLIDNIKPGRTEEDLLFQVMLDWAIDLTLPVKQDIIEGVPVFFVDDNALAACFAPAITENLIQAIAARKPLRAVFRDSGFENDAVKINAEQIFHQLSPGTEMRVI